MTVTHNPNPSLWKFSKSARLLLYEILNEILWQWFFPDPLNKFFPKELVSLFLSSFLFLLIYNKIGSLIH
ncbi:hypothetical protein CICLE_v10023210mg [Citrus x clementina]|uniref:Uncharacterized protein n=1 Tax=Citrus clementina TaxID=85681 RepID=V4VTV5_CITCL|nr:hypothetical protein CICLE_v10023210mg [Citrus x clementina]